jgi:flagellar protein FlaG
MASSVMTEAILIIASIVVATSIAGVVMSQVGSFESTFTSTSEAQKNEMLTKIKIVHAMYNTTGGEHLEVWVKNIGIDPITSPTTMDVYYGGTTSAQRIPFSATAAEDTWRFKSTPPTIIQKMDTIQIRIQDASGLATGQTYLIRINAPNGVYADYVLST